MWKYLEGVEPPQKKKQKTSEERKEQQANYEKQSRNRSFLESWKSGRPWLQFDKEKSAMFCSTCVEAAEIDPSVPSQNFFITGCTSASIHSVKIHEGSANHVKAGKVVYAKHNPKQTVAYKIVSTLTKAVMEKLSKMVRTCHALAVKNRPYSDFEWQCELDEAKGIEVGGTYRTAEYAKVFMHAIAQVECKKLCSKIQSSRFVAVLGDGTTNSSITEQEMFFFRTCNVGEVSVSFAAVKQVEKGNEAGIHEALQSSVSSPEHLQIPWNEFASKLVALGCDGASVMTGHSWQPY